MNLQPIWTTKKPTQPGWYWYRCGEADMPHPIKVYVVGLSLYAWPIDDERDKPQPVEQCAGEFAPLVPPYIPAYVARETYY